MDLHCWRSLFYIVFVLIASVSAQGSNNATYSKCDNATCPMIGCRRAELDFNSSLTEVYSRDINVICLNANPNADSTYQLTGCPDIFSSTIGLERTDGVCTNKTSQGTDLFLTLSQTVAGLYNFSCFTPIDNFKSNYAIIVNDTNTYRDILLFVNGIIHPGNSLNINEGDNVTIIARAVGAVTRVEVNNATGFEEVANGTRFSCGTGFPCNKTFSDDTLDNRYQLCTLTNAAASTDNQTLNFFVHYNVTGQNIVTELGEVNVTVYPPTPSTSTITNSPTPTDSPTDKAGGNDATVIGVVVAVVVVLIIIILLLSITIFLYVYHRISREDSSSQEKHIDSKSSPDGGMRKLRVLIYTCNHIDVNLLVTKLKENHNFEVEELTDDPASQLSDNVSKLHSEISQGSVLIDCSCPGGVHSTMHTVVKSYIQKPSGDPDSSRWQIIQLNNCDTDEETSPSWSKSKLYDYVDVMDYSNLESLDVVVNHVEHKLMEYSGSRTWSIHSSENDNTSLKQHLLPEQRQRAVGVSGQQATNDTQLLEEVKGISKKVDVLASQGTERHKEVQESLKGNKELLEQVVTQEEAIASDTQKIIEVRTSQV